ncbi:MAG: haloacid dehalogenase-like hydrolase [Myxococcota bacterium]|nr:haloacid dehalogenase-like hydrolase [Myxococcota bacterium]
MELWSPDQAWARIEALARAEPGGVVATDGDGTLWTGDVGEDLFHAFLREGRVEPLADEAIRREARSHALSDAGSGREVAQRLYDGYGDGRFPEERLCELMAWCFAGWTEGDLRAFARGVVDRGELPGRVQEEVRFVLDRARAAAIDVVLVSASPMAVVVEAACRLGFSPEGVVAALPQIEGGRISPAVQRPIPYGPGKVSRLRERVGPERVLYAAFGDNIFDVALLAGARLPFAVRPKARLRARANDVPHLVELAPAPDTLRAGSIPAA